MVKQAQWRAPREEEHAAVVVVGSDESGNLFDEETQLLDVSESGLSFYLKTPIWMDSHLTLKVRARTLFGTNSVLKGKVVRIQNVSSGRKIIGVRLD